MERCKPPPGFDMTLGRGAPQPVQAIDAADGNARAFQVGSPDPVFALCDAGTRGASEERKGLCTLPIVGKPSSVSQRCRRRQRVDYPTEETPSIFVPAARPSFAGVAHGSRIASDATGRIRPSR